jgi:hypothetical protein
MFCANCGNSIEEGAKFCDTCGTKIDAVEPVHYEAQPISATPKTVYAVSINNQQSGPYTLGQLETMIQNRQVTLSYWVCVNNAENWVKLNEVPELKVIFDRLYTPPIQVVQRDDTFSNKRLRHGFTSFWLWLMFICYILVAVILWGDLFLNGGQLSEEAFPYLSNPELWVLRITVLLLAFAAKGIIFDWNKSGFWMIVGGSVVSIFLSPTEEDLLGLIIGQAIVIGILFCVLLFKNAFNAKSTWEQLR